ncbi:hypothetical protein WJX82_008652 [Trebouxia sp. C0006]
MSEPLDRVKRIASHLTVAGSAKSETAFLSADVLIVGGGVIGVATAYAICKSRSDLRVVLLEAGEFGAVNGSSYGDSRMYRELYSSEYCSVMQTEALKLWHELEQQSGQQLLKRHGLLFYGDTDTGETVQGSLLQCQAVAERRGLCHRRYSTAAELQAAYPMNAKEGYEGLFENGAGTIKAKEAVAAMLKLAQQAGLHIVQGERVICLSVLAADQVAVQTSTGRTIMTKRLGLTVGAWTNDVLAHLGLELPLDIWKVHWGHYYVDPAIKDSIPQWYKFGKLQPDSWDEGLYYGFPPEGSEPVVKVGVDFAPHARSCRMKSMQNFSYKPDAMVAASLDTFLKAEWKGFLQRRDLYCSPYTMTADGMFILDQLPGFPQISLFTGGNGRAFKFSVLLGRCLSDLLLGQQPMFDIGPLSAKRKAVRPVQAPHSVAARLHEGPAAAIP